MLGCVGFRVHFCFFLLPLISGLSSVFYIIAVNGFGFFGVVFACHLITHTLRSLGDERS
jgi:hypothetical protein